MYIGEVAEKTGLTVKAIRFYEEKGLIPKPKRLGRYRVFSQSDIELLILIKEAKSLGISLSELQQVIQYQDGKVNWPAIKRFLQSVKIQIKNDIEDLKRKIKLIDTCMEQINEE